MSYRAGVHQAVTIFYNCVQLLADIFGRSKQNVSEAFVSIEKEFAKMSLTIDESKAKYLYNANNWKLYFRSFQGLYYFDVGVVIQQGITIWNHYYFELSRKLECRVLSKMNTYKPRLVPVLYASHSDLFFCSWFTIILLSVALFFCQVKLPFLLESQRSQ